MTVLRRQGNPAGCAYAALCRQVVTVYRRNGADSITRTVHPRAFLSFDEGRNVERTGSKESTSFLLVIPGDADVAPGDRVLLGEGPSVSTDAAWRSFIPSKVEGLVVVGHVDRHPWDGGFPHVEARG